jgi:hypothetical protein
VANELILIVDDFRKRKLIRTTLQVKRDDRQIVERSTAR